MKLGLRLLIDMTDVYTHKKNNLPTALDKAMEVTGVQWMETYNDLHWPQGGGWNGEPSLVWQFWLSMLKNIMHYLDGIIKNCW